MLSLRFKQGFMIVGMSVYATSSVAGTIDNTVTVKGTGPDEIVDGIEVYASESVTVVAANSELTITKSHEFKTGNADTYADEGEIITYIFKVENTGNVTITDVEVTEESFNGNGGIVVPVLATPALTDDVEPTGDSTDIVNSTDAKWGILSPGDAVTFEGDYTVVQDDIDQLQN